MHAKEIGISFHSGAGMQTIRSRELRGEKIF